MLGLQATHPGDRVREVAFNTQHYHLHCLGVSLRLPRTAMNPSRISPPLPPGLLLLSVLALLLSPLDLPGCNFNYNLRDHHHHHHDGGSAALPTWRSASTNGSPAAAAAAAVGFLRFLLPSPAIRLAAAQAIPPAQRESLRHTGTLTHSLGGATAALTRCKRNRNLGRFVCSMIGRPLSCSYECTPILTLPVDPPPLPSACQCGRQQASACQ